MAAIFRKKLTWVFGCLGKNIIRLESLENLTKMVQKHDSSVHLGSDMLLTLVDTRLMFGNALVACS